MQDPPTPSLQDTCMPSSWGTLHHLHETHTICMRDTCTPSSWDSYPIFKRHSVTPHLHETQSHPIFMRDTCMQSSWKTHTIFSKDTDTSSLGETPSSWHWHIIFRRNNPPPPPPPHLHKTFTHDLLWGTLLRLWNMVKVTERSKVHQKKFETDYIYGVWKNHNIMFLMLML